MSKPMSASARAKRLEQLSRFMTQHGLKSTKQRDTIVQMFLDSTEHISAEDLHAQVKQKDQNVGFATVYRTLKLLTDSGLANRRHFGDGLVRYENTFEGEHHDHMICTACGSITEFESQALNSIRQELAQRKGFRITHHKTEFYGLCKGCAKQQ